MSLESSLRLDHCTASQATFRRYRRKCTVGSDFPDHITCYNNEEFSGLISSSVADNYSGQQSQDIDIPSSKGLVYSARWRAGALALALERWRVGALARWPFTNNQEHGLQTFTTSLNAILQVWSEAELSPLVRSLY